MSNQGSVCRMIMDTRDVLSNDIFIAIQRNLIENNVDTGHQKVILDNIKNAVAKNIDGLVDRVIKVVD